MLNALAMGGAPAREEKVWKAKAASYYVRDQGRTPVNCEAFARRQGNGMWMVEVRASNGVSESVEVPGEFSLPWAGTPTGVSIYGEGISALKVGPPFSYLETDLIFYVDLSPQKVTKVDVAQRKRELMGHPTLWGLRCEF